MRKSDIYLAFIMLLTVFLFAMKINNLIALSWFWVFAPIWITLLVFIGLFFTLLLVFMIVSVIAYALEAYHD